MSYFVVMVLATGFALAIAAMAGAIAQSRAISSAVEGIARQPEAGPRLMMAMLIGLAFIESLVIYTLIPALVLLFTKLPDTKAVLEILGH